MKSGEPGSPRRRGPPRQAYQYVRPLAVTFAIPLMLILTMARAELLQLTVEVVLDRLSPTRNDNDPAVLGDLDPHVLHTRLSSGPNGSGDVGLPECGGRASHCDYREACLSAVISGRPSCRRPGRAPAGGPWARGSGNRGRDRRRRALPSGARVAQAPFACRKYQKRRKGVLPVVARNR